MDRRDLLKGMGVGILAIAGCSGEGANSTGDQTTQSTTSNPTTTTETTTKSTTEATDDEPTTTEQQAATIPIGKAVGSDALKMVVRDVTRKQNLNQFQEADEGNEFLLIRLVVKNITSDSDVDVSGLFQTRVKDGQSYTYPPTFGVTEHPFVGGTLAPGEVSRGDVVYEVPKDASDLTMQFDFSGISLFNLNRVTIDLSERANPIQDLSQNITIDVYEPGQSVAYDDLKVKVNSIEYESSLGSFVEAADGYEYAIIDITTTNNTNDKLSVSTLLQMSCKDGRGFTYSGSLTALSQLDRAYPQGSPLGPGEERRGKIPYEVPKDAGTLYWMFEFSIWVNGFKTFWKVK